MMFPSVCLLRVRLWTLYLVHGVLTVDIYDIHRFHLLTYALLHMYAAYTLWIQANR